jgi:hypothetical protein
MPLEEDFFQIIQKNRAERELFEQEAGEKLKPV